MWFYLEFSVKGCPLSLYLFLLFVESFSCLIQEAEEGQILEMRCSRNGPRVNHLFFADNSIIFARANRDEADEIKTILGVYEKASRQQINLIKSTITFTPNISRADRKRIKRHLGLTSSLPHYTYFGLPIVIGKNKKMVFASFKDRAWKKI